MPVRIEEEVQEVVEQLSSDLNLDPAFVRKFFTRNVVERVFSYLLAWDKYLNLPRRLKCDSEGYLYVNSRSVQYQYNDVKSGTASDNWSAPITFDQVCGRVDVMVFDNDMLLQRSVDGSTWQDTIELPANMFYSFDANTLAIRVMNKTAGANARYQIIGWY
jgi:hypothetical protein